MPTSGRLGHDRYDYLPIVDRPVLRWPGDARLAVWVIPNIEYFHPDEPGPAITPGLPGHAPDVLNFAWRDYGPRVGIWRTIQTLDRHNIRATVSLNGEACLAYPEIIEAGKARGWEFMGHGVTNSQSLAGLDEATERDVIARAMALITEAVGERPRGWLGPKLAENHRTPDLLAEAGLDYVCEWCNDDQPYEMHVRRGSLLSIPYAVETNDMMVFVSNRHTARDYYEILVDQFDVLLRDAEETGRVMAVPLHPYLTGQPFRDKYLDLALAHMRHQPGVWFATGSEIVDHYRAVVRPAAAAGR